MVAIVILVALFAADWNALMVESARLDPRKFRRIPRGTIVNVDFIRELQPWFNGCYRVILHSGVELSLSREYRGKQGDLL